MLGAPCPPAPQAYELGAAGDTSCLVVFPVKTRPSGRRGCIFVAFILFFLLSPCPHARSLWALINVCSHKHTHCPFSLARLRATHTHKHAHSPSTPVPGVDTSCKPPLCGSASLCHQPLSFSKLPVGKAHNFYTTQP